MIQAFSKPKLYRPTEKDYLEENQDIIVTKYQNKTIYNEDGSITVKRIPKLVNITKRINETKKLIKKDSAAEKLAELERIFTKEK